MLFFLGAFLVMGSVGYAQTGSESENSNNQGTEASVHGSTISDLAKNATVTGKERGSLISSAARAKALTVANVNARFIRGDAKPSNANANANASVNASASVNGKPATLPPVAPPTNGQPLTTPVGKPVGVPVGVAATHSSVHAGPH